MTVPLIRGNTVAFHELNVQDAEDSDQIHIGATVKLDPGLGEAACAKARVIERDDETGFWFAEVL